MPGVITIHFCIGYYSLQALENMSISAVKKSSICENPNSVSSKIKDSQIELYHIGFQDVQNEQNIHSGQRVMAVP